MNTKSTCIHILNIVLFLVIINLFSCKTDTELVLADLLFDFARIDQPAVDLGIPLVVESAIMNEPKLCEDCETMVADVNDRSIRVQYRPDENAPWTDAQLKDQAGNITYELVIPVPEIPPGGKHLKSEGFSFTTPGFYRYLFTADRLDVVEERNESNNDTDSNNGTVGKGIAPKYQLEVEVFDVKGEVKPNYHPTSIPVTVIYLGGK